MGKRDDYQYDYLDNCERFADQVNGALFGGRQVVKPDELEPADVAGQTDPYHHDTEPDLCGLSYGIAEHACGEHRLPQAVETEEDSA